MCFLEFGGFQIISWGLWKNKLRGPLFVDSKSIYFLFCKSTHLILTQAIWEAIILSKLSQQIYIYIKKILKIQEKKYEDLEPALGLSWELTSMFLFSSMNLRQTQYTYSLFLSLKAIQFLVLWEIYEKFYEKFKGHVSVIKNFCTIKRYKVKNLPLSFQGHFPKISSGNGIPIFFSSRQFFKCLSINLWVNFSYVNVNVYWYYMNCSGNFLFPL